MKLEIVVDPDIFHLVVINHHRVGILNKKDLLFRRVVSAPYYKDHQDQNQL